MDTGVHFGLTTIRRGGHVRAGGPRDNRARELRYVSGTRWSKGREQRDGYAGCSSNLCPILSNDFCGVKKSHPSLALALSNTRSVSNKDSFLQRSTGAGSSLACVTET